MTLILGLAFISLVYFLFFKGRITINKDVELKYKENIFSIYCNADRLVATEVDSIIVAHKYGTMIFGIGQKSKIKQWIYIDGSNKKNIYDGYSPNEFREKIIYTIGEKYLDSIVTTNELWIKYYSK